MIDYLSQVVTALDFVFDLSEDLPDFIFDGVRSAGLLSEAAQVREELVIDEIPQVVAGKRFILVDLAVLAFGCRPASPAILLFEKKRILFTIQFSLDCFVLLQAVEVFQEQQP
jgi:hypothetical protein